jgi:hypothetical protein
MKYISLMNHREVIAARTSAAPGPGGKGVARQIQVRPVMHRPPDPEL